MSQGFIFVAIGSYGDVHPHVGLALSMRSRGHKVAIASNGHFRSLVEQNNIEFIELSVEQDYLDALNSPDLWNGTKGTKTLLNFISKNIREIYDILLQRWQHEHFVLVSTPLCFSARLLQETHQSPLITVHLQPMALRTYCEVPGIPMLPSWSPPWLLRFAYWLADTLMVDPILAPILNSIRQDLGLAPVSRIINNWWNSPQRIIGLWPDWFANTQPDWPEQTVLTGFPLYDESSIAGLPKELESFLANGSAPIAFTPGTAMQYGQQFFETAIDACVRINRRGILLTRFSDNVPANLPDSIIHIRYAPFSQLLPHCAALVHHGGIGTLSQGFASGIPQFLMPMAHDQPDNLLRLQRLGTGDGLPPKQFKSKAVAAKLDYLLNNKKVIRRCQNIKTRIANKHPLEQACDILEAELAGTRKA